MAKKRAQRNSSTDRDEDLVPLSEIGLDTHIDVSLGKLFAGYLSRLGLVTLRHVQEASDDQLLSIKGFACTRLKKARAVVARAALNTAAESRLQQERARDQLLREIASLRQLAAKTRENDTASPQT